MSARASVFRRAFADGFPAERPAPLSEREWAMLAAHIRDGRTLDDIARQHGVTRARIRQVCARAMGRLGYSLNPPDPPTDPVARPIGRYARRRALEAWWYGRGPFPR